MILQQVIVFLVRTKKKKKKIDFLELVNGLLMVCWESSSQAATISVSEEDQFFESQSLVAQDLGKTFSILRYFNQIWDPAYLVLNRIPFPNMLFFL